MKAGPGLCSDCVAVASFYGLKSTSLECPQAETAGKFVVLMPDPVTVPFCQFKEDEGLRRWVMFRILGALRRRRPFCGAL